MNITLHYVVDMYIMLQICTPDMYKFIIDSLILDRHLDRYAKSGGQSGPRRRSLTKLSLQNESPFDKAMGLF